MGEYKVIQQTSLSSFQEVRKELGKRQMIVYECLKRLGSANNTILSRELGLPINQVTPRVNELRKMRLVIVDCMRCCPVTNKLTLFWRVA